MGADEFNYKRIADIRRRMPYADKIAKAANLKDYEKQLRRSIWSLTFKRVKGEDDKLVIKNSIKRRRGKIEEVRSELKQLEQEIPRDLR